MKPFRLSLVLSLFSLLLTGSAMAATISIIEGYIIYGGSYNVYAGNATVRVCTSTAQTHCRGALTNSTGKFTITNWQGVADPSRLYFYVWKDMTGATIGRTGFWGSKTIPIYNVLVSSSGIGYMALELYPAPLEPVAVNPAPNAENVGLAQTLKWTNSTDSWRTYHNIVYDIYGSGYDAPLLLQVSNLPCNPDANNRCQWELPIFLDPQTPYNWKIVAKAQFWMNFTTESQVYHFTTGW